MALPMPFRFLRLLALLPLIDLLAMNFRILVSDSLTLRALEARCFMEVSIPRIRVKGYVWIIVELNVEHTFTTRYVEGRVYSRGTLLSCVERGVSCLTDLMILTLSLVFKFDIAWRIVRLIFIHSVAFLLDTSVVFFFAFA